MATLDFLRVLEMQMRLSVGKTYASFDNKALLATCVIGRGIVTFPGPQADQLSVPALLMNYVDSGPTCLCGGNYLKYALQLNYEQIQDIPMRSFAIVCHALRFCRCALDVE
jgi:hypothetical protein